MSNPDSRSGWREVLVAGVLILLAIALVVGACIVPRGRSRTARDPVAQAIATLHEVSPGMPRKAVEARLRSLDLVRPDGIEVFQHPDTDALRIDLRFAGPGQDDLLLEAGPPYLAGEPAATHLPAVTGSGTPAAIAPPQPPRP